jgi:hypothetical protein
VESAAFADEPPGNLFSAMTTVTFTVPAAGSEPAKVKAAQKEIVGANYFTTLHVKIATGREFSARDEEGATGAVAQPAVLSVAAAEQMFGKGDPIGRRIVWEKQTFDVVGVAPDLTGSAFDMKPEPVVFVPLSKLAYSRPPAGGMTLIVRAGAGTSFEAIRREIAAIDPNLTVFNTRTMAEFLEQSNTPIRWTSFVYGGFGVFGLVLACVGLAGVTAYSVAQRRKEIGIRMALGAQRGQMLRLVMKEGAALVMVGSALGFLGAWGVGKGIAALMPEIAEVLKAKQPLLLMIGAPLLLGGLAMLACYFPARRSTAVDPLVALRQE